MTAKNSFDFNKYSVHVTWSEEDHIYIAEIPELAWCAADGKTRTEALENVHSVFLDWIETAEIAEQPIPEPKTVYEPLGASSLSTAFV